MGPTGTHSQVGVAIDAQHKGLTISEARVVVEIAVHDIGFGPTICYGNRQSAKGQGVRPGTVGAGDIRRIRTVQTPCDLGPIRIRRSAADMKDDLADRGCKAIAAPPIGQGDIKQINRFANGIDGGVKAARLGPRSGRDRAVAVADIRNGNAIAGRIHNVHCRICAPRPILCCC